MIGRTYAAAALAGALTLGSATGAMATLIGPQVNYLSFADSPFHGLPFSYFHLDTFESGAITAPGVAVSAGSVIGPGYAVDSVDGAGHSGHSLFSGSGAAGITFTFDAGVLGHLPTDAGIVWTDGDGPSRTFKAFDENGNSLGSIVDSSQLFYSTGGDGAFHNYRFFGVTNPGGISSFSIANDSGGIEVDHLQYGLAGPGVPEPASWAILLVGFGVVGGAFRLRRRPAMLIGMPQSRSGAGLGFP